MGVLGWTEKDTLDSSLQGIAAALHSRKRFVGDILCAVFGKPDTPNSTTADAARPMSPQLFDALFG